MMNWVDELQTFMPHGMCLLWRPELMLLHIGSDALIALAYFAIPFGIAQFVRGRQDLETKHRVLALLFAVFITLCGFTHLASILVLWYPIYVTEGWLKGVTPLVSVATALFVLPIVPQLLRLPSAKLLQREIDDHRVTLEELTQARAALALRFDLTKSELRKAEANHALSDTLLHAVIEAVPGLIYAKDSMGRMLLANRSALELIGKPWDMVRGRTDAGFLGDKHQADAVMTNDMLVMKLDQQQEVEEIVDHPVKGTRVFLSTKLPLHEASGAVSGLVGVSIDITDRKRLQTESRIALEDALAQKTAALDQRDVLLREVYHRVKNNLQIIDSFLVMQGQALKDVEAKDALKSLRGRVYALGLVHHQLMAAKDYATFDIAPFLRELVDNIMDGGATSGIHLSVIAEPMAVGLDFAIPLGLLVTELVTNAVKHAFPSGTGNVAVSLTHQDNGEILLFVRDDGRGMTRAKAESNSAGVGLGTAILKALVRQLRGTITMREDLGTKIEVRFSKVVLS